MKVSIKNNIKEFEKEYRKFQRVDLKDVTRIALNDTAKKVQHFEVLSMKKSFDRPRPSTLKALFIQFAKKNNLTAILTFRDWAQEYIYRNIEGGIRPVKNTAVPTINAKLNQYGNIPGRRTGVVKGKQFRATIGGVYGVWERGKNNQLKIIHRFETNPQYKPIYPFYRVAQKAAEKFMPLNFQRIAEYYIKKAGYKSK